MAIALDRLSTLPDGILCVILSKLSLREAIQCSVLSKRWRFLYREMPTLILSPYLLTPPHLRPPTPDPLFLATVENIISKILQSHSSDLTAVRLSNDIAPWNPSPISSPWQFTRESISIWLHCISRKNVEHLVLRDSPARESPAPEALFSCTRLTMLTLYNYILTRIPTQFAGFKHLFFCNFISLRLTDDSLTVIISHCPLLERLHLLECVGLRRPVISALNVTNLILGVHGLQVLTVNCPKLKYFRNLRQVKDLRVNGVLFQELSPAIKALEMYLGNNLISLGLDSSARKGEYNCSANKFLEIVGSLKSLKALDIHFWPLSGRRGVAVPVFNLLRRLPNLERFSLEGYLILEELQRNPVPSYLSSSVANLQSLVIRINKCDETEIGLLGCLLQRSPQLKRFKFYFSDHEGERSKWFLDKWEDMKRGHVQGNIPEKLCEFIFYF